MENVMLNNENENENDFGLNEHRMENHRSSLIARHISFSQREATSGEILLVLSPYILFLFDVFIFFLLKGFQ